MTQSVITFPLLGSRYSLHGIEWEDMLYTIFHILYVRLKLLIINGQKAKERTGHPFQNCHVSQVLYTIDHLRSPVGVLISVDFFPGQSTHNLLKG